MPRGRRLALSTAALALAVLAVAAWLSWPHLRFWWLFEPLGLNAQGYPEYRHRRTGIVMVRVPGGKFWMGAQWEDPKGQNYDPDAEESERPVHEVTLSPFLIAKYEVTQTEWRGVLGEGPSESEGDDLPVEQVSWDDCQEFCRRTGLVLPSEAQWEYACRGNSDARYCFGADSKLFPEYAWWVASIDKAHPSDKTHPVGKRLPNGFGLHDVHGNVWEWCEDTYDKGFYGRAAAGGVDPVCRSGSEFGVVRGGGGWDDPRCCRSAIRNGLPLESRSGKLGLRPAFPLP